MKLSYKEFKVYQDTKILIAKIFRATRQFGNGYYFLADQINRAVLSIALNIAEGSAKTSNKDFNRYIQNALGSATELSAAIEIAYDLKLIGEADYRELEIVNQSVLKQLGGFSKFLKKNL